MGLQTQLSLSWNDSEHASGSLSVERVIDAARTFVIRQNWSEDVLTDLRDSMSTNGLGPPAFNRVLSYGVIELLRSVSEQIPDVVFYAKGAGEEFWDIWFREFKAGSELRGSGPFDEHEAPIPEELLAQAKAAHAAALERSVNSEKAEKSGWFSKLFR